jgi:hypothetical protein
MERMDVTAQTTQQHDLHKLIEQGQQMPGIAAALDAYRTFAPYAPQFGTVQTQTVNATRTS